MPEREHHRRRPVVLDADEREYLPDVVYIPVHRADGAIRFELREMADSRLALPVYSSMARLIAALGGAHLATRRPSTELPRLRRQLGFQALLLDVVLPNVKQPDPQPLPLTLDRATGEPMVFVPSRPFGRANREAKLELQRLADGQVALLTYSSLTALTEGCGLGQHYVAFPAGRLETVRQQAGADTVLIDVALPQHLRHS